MADEVEDPTAPPTSEEVGDPVAEPGSDELLGEMAVTRERARLEIESAARQAEELVAAGTEPVSDDEEEGEPHPAPGVPDAEEEHPEYDPTPPADDDYAVPG